MDDDFYDFSVLDEAHRFDFISVGRTAIYKAAIYFPTKIPELYTLTLADVEQNGELNVYSVSNNGDMKYILSTVFQTIVHFLRLKPNAVVGFTGSTESRTRLYQIGIAREIHRLEKEFQVFGLSNNAIRPEKFECGRSYMHFFICLKNRKFD